MKTKLLALLLLAGMLFSAVACAKSKGGNKTISSEGDGTGTSVSDSETEQPPIIPEDLRFDGMSYVALCRMHNSFFEDEIFIEEDNARGDALNEALYTKMLLTEERFGITISKVEQADMYAMNDRIRTDIQSGDPSYNIIAHFVYHAPALALEGQLYNWYDVPYVSESLQRNSEWWPSSLVDMSTINDQLYFVSGDVAISALKTLNVLFMNKTVAADKNIEGIYDTVRNGDWTLDEFISTVTTVTEDLNGDSIYDDNDLYGFATHYFDHYFATFDIPIVKETSDGQLEMAVYTERFVDTYDKLYDLFHNYDAVYSPSKIMNDKSITAKLFMEDKLLFMGHLTHQADVLRDMKSEYNILPWPKYDDNQAEYQTVSHNNYSTFCVPISVGEEELEMVGAVTEYMAQKSYTEVTPVYKEVVLKYKYSTDDNNREMLDIVFDSIIFDFGITYSYVISDVGFLYRNIYKNSESISNLYYGNVDAYNIALVDIINKFSMMGD